MLKALALDFDGVICDGFGECVLVTWYAQRGARLADFSAAGMSAIPARFVRQFSHCRAFAKHLPHFYTSFLDGIEGVRTQEEFEALYATAPTADVEAFVTALNAYRGSVRELLPERWLSEQALYPGMADFLRQSPWPLYIVTAKDAASVASILEHAQVPFERRRIFGEQRDKRAALGQICGAEALLPTELGFLDDNVLNAAAAKHAGFRAFWALWGYRAPDHVQIAERHQLTGLSLEQITLGRDWSFAA
ncbi:MAG TPA: hypothetical protein VHP33_30590 [Polyangiaceae bacterium]|nr:hypothetical protein [Polyangiaceae bacterium]